MGWIVKKGRRNLFGDSVFPTKASATDGLIDAIRGGGQRDARSYIDPRVVQTKKPANVTH